jgi:SAM-dependent methyltransferase
MTGSNFARRVLAGEETSPEEWQQHLRAVHDRLPGMTAAVFSHHTTAGGRTSYQMLAERVGVAARSLNRPVDVLDLACGDGYLIEVCLHQFEGEIRTIAGVDMSDGELDLARRRLEGTIARFHIGLAQSLPIAPDSVDVALCHAAFMLMLPIEPVVRELARVLRPGGTFSAVVGSTLASAHTSDGEEVEEARALWEEIRTTLQTFWREEFPRLQIDRRLGDDRAMTGEGWGELFPSETGYTGDVDEQQFEIIIRDSAEGLWSFCKETYLADMLDKSMQERLRSRVISVLAGHEHPSGTMTMAFPLQQLSVHKR